MLELLAASAALAGRALLQAADAALLAVGEDEVRERAADHPQRVKWLLELKANPEPTAASLRAASSSLLAFAAVGCAIVVGDVLLKAGWPATSRGTLQLTAGVVAGAVALALDLAPRSLAAVDPVAWGLALSGPAWVVSRLFGPPVRLLLRLFDALLLRQGATARYTPPPPPLEELEKLLSDEARNRTPGAPTAELVHGLFSFAERTAKEIMVPRTRVVGVPLDADPQQVIDLLAEEGHTRMPVFEGDLDHIRGVLHAKDVIQLLAHPELIVLQDLLRPALFAPWTKPVGELLREMQQKRSLIALIVDEYGGFSGVVTLEDILEEIVGEIRDEHDVDQTLPAPGPDGALVLRADTRLSDLNRSLGTALADSGDFETVSGLLNNAAGAIPQTGDRFFIGGLEFTVMSRDDRRVRVVRVARPVKTVPPPPVKGH
ncbi:MAG TPA: hemolysin family protein [Myxococcales bacterium]|nr:hemolysin family protein [Myxococcales bacterium]